MGTLNIIQNEKFKIETTNSDKTLLNKGIILNIYFL